MCGPNRAGMGTRFSLKNNIDGRNGTNFGNAWQSPVPYLLGGVVAMLLVIGFAFIILAFSWWRSPSSNGAQCDESVREDEKDDVDEEQGDKVAVIMAGDENPTFIATPTPIAA